MSDFCLPCNIYQRGHEKKDMYNLNEEEELTHFGQSLAEMEKFNDLVDSDNEPEEKGLLSGESKSQSWRRIPYYNPNLHPSTLLYVDNSLSLCL